MTIIKVCGIRTLEAALEAARSGADLIGLIFAPSKRRISPEDAKQLIQETKKHLGLQSGRRQLKFQEEGENPELWFQNSSVRLKELKIRPLFVGVFSNQTPEEINQIAELTEIDFIQLHGEEPDEICHQLILPVIRAIHVRETDQIETIKERIHKGFYSFILLDTGVTGMGQQGGSGIAFDWNLAVSLSADYPFLLAGGLTPKNVQEGILKTNCWGVDVSSGVETDGKKDLEKIRHFVLGAKNLS